MIIWTTGILLVLLFLIATCANHRFERCWRKDVLSILPGNINPELLTENDILHLPSAVQCYIRYTGFVGKPKLSNMRVVFEGEMRNKKQKWFTFRSEQFNLFETPTRLFFMKARMFGNTIPGYHRYINATATMDIRLFGLLPVVKKQGSILNKAETVTLFNDICLMAPGALIDPRIQWEEIDSLRVKAIFTNHDIRVSAFLVFNEAGQLVNFLSDDRTDISDMVSYPFSTPCHKYREFGGYRLFSKGEAVWHYPNGEFVYGRFHLKEIDYNVKHLK